VDWFRLVGFFALGKTCIYILQVFPLTFTLADWIDKKIHYSFFGKLVRCNLCLGVWVYSFWVASFQMYPVNDYVPIATEFAFGAAASFIMYLLELGWKTQFGIIKVEE